MDHHVARWESRSGKHYVDLFFDPELKLANGQTTYSAWYHAFDAGGNLGKLTEAEAIVKMQTMVDSGYFQPDANKTPMRRTR